MELRYLPNAYCPTQQRVGEPGRPCLPWKQEIGGSNPPTLTNLGNRQSNLCMSRLPIADCLTTDGWPSGKATRC
jgi:hypothetical protein